MPRPRWVADRWSMKKRTRPPVTTKWMIPRVDPFAASVTVKTGRPGVVTTWPPPGDRKAIWQPSVLAQFYADETLASPRAREGFVLPQS